MTVYRNTGRLLSALTEAERAAVAATLPAPDGDRWILEPVSDAAAADRPTQSINGIIVLLTDAEIAQRAADEAAVAPERRLVPKSTVIARLTDRQLASARAIFNQQPRMEARWYSPDHPAVYADDPDTLALLKAIGADPAVVMAE